MEQQVDLETKPCQILNGEECFRSVGKYLFLLSLAKLFHVTAPHSSSWYLPKASIQPAWQTPSAFSLNKRNAMRLAEGRRVKCVAGTITKHVTSLGLNNSQPEGNQETTALLKKKSSQICAFHNGRPVESSSTCQHIAPCGPLHFDLTDSQPSGTTHLASSLYLELGEHLGFGLRGVVRVSLADMDRETRENYTVVIQAKDMGGQLGGLAGTTTVNITLSDVNDNPPMFDQRLYQMSVPESVPVGSVVGRIWAKDRDIGVNAEMKYSIIDGDGRDTFDISTDPTNLFGIITVKKPLNFENKLSYTLKVEGANTHLDPAFRHRGPFKDVTIVHVSVEDVDEPPVFDLPAYYIELPEDSEIGTMVKTVTARDPDAANNTVRYSIERSSDPEKYFYIEITSGSLMTVRSLDREEIGWHNITVLAMEMNNPTQIASVSVAVKVLDVNDNPPSLTHYLEAYMCENAKAGQLIQTVTAVDPDEPLGGQHFYYSLAPEAANNPNFTLRDNQDNTAWILTRRGGWSQQDQTTFYLPISISDGEQPVQTSTSTLTIRVCSCDQEGNVMSCNAEAYSLPASLSRGALIAILACIFVLLVMILLMLSLRTHRKKPYLCDEEENVHENIVRYDDEGGGEEDTEAFDIAAMWNPREAHQHLGKMRQDMLPEIESLSRYVPQACVMGGGGDSSVHGYVLAKLLEADMDPCAPPYDSLQTYAYEGEGSVAESLSSLQSGTSNTDHEYDYLNDWGPRFKKLAEMYGVLEANIPPTCVFLLKLNEHVPFL
ncbi:Cadherin-20 F-cadherin MN-cadherin Precursor [Channa argus]|uniref:Cadherin-20 n=1 Tax=Channa argus TaxID=215402 RepID=A0A6G1QP08_CHAAH|nr:Cadherin-20 F-cadherin MN-cadherin Precursor [Channa argus]